MNRPALPPIAEDRRLSAIADSQLADSAPEPFLDSLCQMAWAVFDAEISVVSLVAENEILLKARVGTDLRRLSRDFGFCNCTIEDDDVLWVEDAQADPRFSGSPLVAEAPYLRFYAGAPIVLEGGLRLGAVCLLDRRPHAPDPVVKAGLAELARSAAVEIERRIRATAGPAQHADSGLTAFVRGAPVPALITDRELCVVEASQAWLRQRGRRRGEVLGRSIYDLLPGAASHWRPVYAAALEGEPQTGVVRSAGRPEQATAWEVLPWRRGGDVGGLFLVTRENADATWRQAA